VWWIQDMIANGTNSLKILQNDPNMRDAGGRQRKMIVFTEHRDTLNYLERKIGGVLGTPDAIVTIHGGTHVSFPPAPLPRTAGGTDD
jgi:hypothetical protein